MHWITETEDALDACLPAAQQILQSCQFFNPLFFLYYINLVWALKTRSTTAIPEMRKRERKQEYA